MIETKEKYTFAVEENLLNGVQEYHGVMKTIFRNLQGPKREKFYITSCQDRYNLTCCLHAYNKENDTSTDATYFVGGRTLTEYYTIDSLIYLCVGINFIDNWLNVLNVFTFLTDIGGDWFINTVQNPKYPMKSQFKLRNNNKKETD